MRNWLRSLGSIGAWIDAAITVAINWSTIIQVAVAAMAGIGAAWWAWWEWATQWGYLPIALVSLFAFVAVLWAWNGVVWLRSQRRPSKQRALFDYSYGLDIAGVHLARDQESGKIQIGAILKNTARGPVQYYVEEMSVVVEDRTLTSPDFPHREGIIPIISERIYFYPPMPQEYFQERSNGVLKMIIKYGHPEIGYLRRTKRTLDLSLRVDEKIGCAYLIKEETDEPI